MTTLAASTLRAEALRYERAQSCGKRVAITKRRAKGRYARAKAKREPRGAHEKNGIWNKMIPEDEMRLYLCPSAVQTLAEQDERDRGKR